MTAIGPGGNYPVPLTPLSQYHDFSLLNQYLGGGGGAGAAAAEAAPTVGAATSTLAANAGKLGLLSQLANKVPGGYATLGIAGSQIASPFIGNYVGKETGNYNAGKATEEALKYGGLGAGIGAMVPIPGAPIVGGLLGTGYGIYKGLNADEPPSAEQQLWKQFDTYNQDNGLHEQIRATYDQLKKSDKNAAMQWLAGVNQQVAQKWTTDHDPFNSPQATTEQNLQLQQLAGQAMAPYVDSMTSNIDAARSSLFHSMGRDLTPAQSERLKPLVDQYAYMSKNVANAYALQAEQFPIQNQLAKSSWAVMQQQAAGGGGSGLSALLQQAAATPAK